jgi:hypothetical protein
MLKFDCHAEETRGSVLVEQRPTAFNNLVVVFHSGRRRSRRFGWCRSGSSDVEMRGWGCEAAKRAE